MLHHETVTIRKRFSYNIRFIQLHKSAYITTLASFQQLKKSQVHTDIESIFPSADAGLNHNPPFF